MAANCIGLDIGSSSIKVVQLKERRNGLSLLKFGINPLPVDSIADDGTIMNYPAVLEALEALFERLNVKKRDVAIAVSGRSVIVKKITIQYMNRKELDEELGIEMEHHIPFARSEVEVDYEVVVPKNAEGEMEVLLVAAKKEIIQDYLDLAAEARLNPVVVDVAAFAVQNLYEKVKGLSKDETLIFLNIGSSSTSINVVIGGVTTFVRDVSIGGDAITGEIQRALQISKIDAEARKREAANGVSSDYELMNAINKVCDVIADEFKRSIDFFLSSVKTVGNRRIVVTGGGSIMKPLIRSIEKKTNMPVEIFDGFQAGIEVDASKFDLPLLQAQAPSASVALGLALRRPGDKR